MSGSLFRALLPDPGLRLFVIEAGDVVTEAIQRHQLTPASAVPLGRTLMASALLAWDAKSGHRVTLQFRSKGPIGGVVADAQPDGAVRGYVHVPQIAFPLGDVQRLAHAALGNRGAVQVIREGEGGRSTGQVQLVTGGIDRDVEALVAASDGQQGALGLGVFFGGSDEEPTLGSAMGAMVLALPGADPYAFDDVAMRVRALSDAPFDGNAKDLLEHLAGNYETETTAVEDLRFDCNCSQDRVTRVLISLGGEELLSLAEDPGYGEVVCHFCNHAYRFEEEALRLMAEGLEPIQGSPVGEA